MRERDFVYTGAVRATFVHHTASGNGYSCSQAPSVIRAIYRYHVKSSGWRDIGYNFLVDKCGQIYEGRAGGVGRPVLGAHTLGFNSNSAGIAAIGTFSSATPSARMLTSIGRVAGWKLGLSGRAAKGRSTLTSGSSSSRYPMGSRHTFNNISGHRDGFSTECPGAMLYRSLWKVRDAAARHQAL
jgi:uncharacterized protein with LGFP repeats